MDKTRAIFSFVAADKGLPGCFMKPRKHAKYGINSGALCSISDLILTCPTTKEVAPNPVQKSQSSVGVFIAQHDAHSAHHDLHVLSKRPGLDIFDVRLNTVFDVRSVADLATKPSYLRQAR